MTQHTRTSKRSRVVDVRAAGPDHQVVSTLGGTSTYRREPCGGCPWRTDQSGTFPAEAFEHSARTAYDMSEHTFACHESGFNKPATCAGFLLRGAEHNLSVRMALISGRISLDQVTDGGHELHESYAAMAVANGVDAAAPVLAACRGQGN